MPSTDYSSLSDSELRRKLSAIGYDLPISINRDFLIRKLQQAEEKETTGTAGSNGTTSAAKKRLSLNVTASPAKLPTKRQARNSIAVNQSPAPPPPAPAQAPSTPTATRSQTAASVTPPRVRKQTPPRQASKPSPPAPTAANSSPPPAQPRTSTSTQRIPFTNRFVNVDESDENNQTDEEAETAPTSPPTLFATTSRKSASSSHTLRVSTASKPASPSTANSSDKYMKYMKLFNNSDNRMTTTYRRSIGSTSSGRFSSDDDDDSDGGSTSVPIRTRTRYFAPRSFWYKIHDYIMNNIPNVLLTTIVTFFLLVVAIYMFNKLQNTSTDPLAVVDSTGKKLESYLQICDDNDVGGKNCIPRDDIVDTKKLFGELRDELNERRRMIDCKSHDDDLASDILSLTKAKSLLYRLSSLNKPRIDATFNHLLYFIIENPKLGLIVVETEESNGTNTHLTKREEIDQSTTELYITTTSTDRAWYCAALKVGLSIISYAGLIGVVALVTFIIYQVYTTIQEKQKEHKKELFNMIEDILNLLQEHHENEQSTNNEPLAIHHIRDNLIQPSERTPEKMQIWTEAIEYILSNDSRVREEMHHIRGEEYRAMKWVPTLSPKRSNSPGGVGGWQGQAFEIVDGSPNSLPLKIPTNCLKVRHMYDSSSPLTDELKAKIEGSLKSKALIQLKHIGYDNHNDSCVYIKCFNKEDAKKAYVNLHGWWYNGNLISVKFLREQRYNTRFPESVN